MLPELSIERVFRRELDGLPLPNEDLWVPARKSAPSPIVAVAVVAAVAVLVLAAGGLIREASGAATHPRGGLTTPPSLQPRASCEPPALGANGRCITLLPNAVRNPAFGYNLVIPGDWHEVQLPPGFEPFVSDQPNASPSLTAPFFLDRHVFTARPLREWRFLSGNAVPAWDLDVQVWDRQGRTALEWSLTLGPCDPSTLNYGPSSCVRTTETIRGVTAVVTTVSTIRGSVKSFFIERGDQMLILRYGTDKNVAPAPGVTEETLERIVRSIGLV